MDHASGGRLSALARAWGRFGWLLASSALLAAAWVAPEARAVATLKGKGGVDSEIEAARAEGYYESLLRVASADRFAGRGLMARTTPPPGWRTFTDSGLVDVVPGYERRRLRAGVSLDWNGERYAINRLGYRGPEVSQEKPPGTFRVVVLGSSNTFGHGVGEGTSYPDLIRDWLSRRAGTGRRVEVVNLAVPGDSPTQQLVRLGEAARLRPDWILSDSTAVDFSLEENHLRWVVRSGAEVPFGFVREALAASGVRPEDSPAAFHRKIAPHLGRLMEATFAEGAALARGMGAPMTVVVLPRVDAKAESPSIFRMYRALSTRYGLSCVDLSAALDALPIDAYRIAPYDVHPNATGHRLIFLGLRDGLVDVDGFLARLAGKGGFPGETARAARR